MPELVPFRGLRYAESTNLNEVVAPPYDVILDNERDDLEKQSLHNAVRLILPRAAGSADAYENAKMLINAWTASGVLVTDEAPAFYAYSMTTERGHQTLGVIGALGVDAPDGEILPHECTLPKARSDRLALLQATRANLDPIWGLSMTSGLTDCLATVPLPYLVVVDGVRHEMGVIADSAQVADIVKLVAANPIVLADGHHRYETARNYYREVSDAPDLAVGADSIMALIVELSESVLDVEPIHRLAAGVPHGLRDRLRTVGEIVAIGTSDPAAIAQVTAEMESRNGIGLIDAEGGAVFVPNEEAVTAAHVLDPIELQNVDSVRFDRIVRPLLGTDELAYRADVQIVAAAVRKKEFDVAILLRPVSVAEIDDVARAQLRMPAKTTYFAPKPRTGMVFRDLDA